jgi:hypothetical protein
MSVAYETDRDQHATEEQALEEIRLLFARYRRAARHGMVTERDEPVEPRATDSEDAPALAGR